MNLSEIHTLIIWSKAAEHKEIIVRKIVQQFSIVKTLNFEWDTNNFLHNLFPFYAHSQRHLNFEDYKNLLLAKIEHCGDGSFQLFVFRDEHPTYDWRETSSGARQVNTNIFDFKTSLREITGGGHKIHASDNTFESNKDLTILLGKNTDDFLENIDVYKDHQKITENCLGVNGFKNIHELFYLLNNSIDYIVLRNYECLPDEYTLEGHGDIDLLVENLNYIVYLCSATPEYPLDSLRAQYNVRIGNENIPFDFRYVGDNYYDQKWQEHLLETKTQFNAVIPVPNDKDHFYSLLYHAYVQKYEVAPDYKIKLERLSEKAKIEYHSLMPNTAVKKILDGFFDKRGYRFVVPVDHSVFYNMQFTTLGYQPKEYGVLLSRQVARLGNKAIFTDVFHNVEKNCIVKVCLDPIASNEANGLTKLKDRDIAPKLISATKKGDFTLLQMEFLKGDPISSLYSQGSFWTLKNIKKIIEDSIGILEILIDEGIQHRDIKPDNFLVLKKNNTFQLKIIDFGWADYDQSNSPVPFLLGSPYGYGEGKFSDPYALGNTLKETFIRFPSIVKIIESSLLTFTPEDNLQLKARMNDVRKNFENLQLTPKEKIILTLKRYPQSILAIKKIKCKSQKTVR